MLLDFLDVVHQLQERVRLLLFPVHHCCQQKKKVILEWQFLDIVHQLQVRLLLFPAHRLSAEEESDFRMAVRLQAELNNQTLCGGSTADCVTSREGNEESNYCGMFVPGQGWKAPTSEPESSAQREEEAANALVQLQRNNIPENTH